MRIATTLAGGALLLLIVHASLANDGHDHGASDEKLPHRDQLRMAAQKICPVSGEKLGTHGMPVKVTVGQQKEEIYLCCQACAKGKLDAKHWATIHANIAKAQGKCPVMQKALPQNPNWTVVNGQIVYVCCPPCTDKIEQAPESYLKRVDGYYTAAIQSAQKTR